MDKIAMNPFDFVRSINESKIDLIRDGSHLELDYIPFIINRNFSLFIDTLFDANEMNMRSQLPSRMQFDYLRQAIKKRKRYSQWPKNKKNEDAYALSQMFSISFAKMLEVLNTINNKQVMELKSLVENVRDSADDGKQRG